jgi:hypothetical protein
MQRYTIATLVLIACGAVACARSSVPAVQARPAPSVSPPTPRAIPLTPAAHAEAKPVVAESDFHIVAMGAALFPTGGDLLLYYEDMLASVDGDTITPHPDYLGTYVPEPLSNMEVVGGQWPKHGLISVSRAAQRSSYSTLYEKNGKGWRKLAGTAVAEWYAGVQPWSKGRTLALVLSMVSAYRWDVVAGPRGVLPKPTILPPKPDERDFAIARVRATAFSALATGDLFALGSLDYEEAPPFGYGIERWAPDTAKSTIDVLPGASDASLVAEPVGIVAASATNVYVFGGLHEHRDQYGYKPESVGAYLAHFDGKGWSTLSFPGKSEITALAVADGTTWAAARESLYKRTTTESAWESVALPDEAKVRALVAEEWPSLKDKPVPLNIRQIYVDKGVVWLAAAVGSGVAEFVLRNRPSPSIWHAPHDTAWTQSVQQFQPYRPADSYCEWRGGHYYVMLYATTKYTPKNYDYPLTRAALKGHPEFRDVEFAETEELGQHYFGAFVPELALAKKLVAVVEKGVKGSKPVALCRNPKKLRILGIDLKTGNVTSNAPAPAE